jgi:hypothetical protein
MDKRVDTDFTEDYRKAYPFTEYTEKALYRVNHFKHKETYFLIRRFYTDITGDFLKYNKLDEEFVERTKQDEQILVEDKGIWLFWRENYDDLRIRLRELIITLNDSKLTVSDYSLLLYLSYQKEDIRKTFEGLPLEMLHGIFEPVMDANIASWFEYVEAACEEQKLNGTPIETIF